MEGLTATSSGAAAQFDTPQPDRLLADSATTFSQQIFDIAITEVESIVEPDSVGNYVERGAVALTNFHRLFLPISAC